LIFTIPLDKNIHKINVSVSTSQSNIGAMHVTSDQGTHFTGILHDEIYPIVYIKQYSNDSNKWRGRIYGPNMIKTKGSQNNVDELVLNKTDVRMILINKEILKTYLQKIFPDIDIKPIYSYTAYNVNDEVIEAYINIHDQLIKNEKVSDEEIIKLLSDIFHRPFTDKLALEKGYDLTVSAICLMQDHLKDPLLLKEISKKLDVSCSTLERTFKKYLNITPKLYYKRLLLLAIETELRNNQAKNISNVINEYQIYNLSQFGASFKNYFNKTPSEVLNLDIKDNPFGWNEKIFIEFSESLT
jgi:AraC-like DNA-binding protein